VPTTGAKTADAAFPRISGNRIVASEIDFVAIFQHIGPTTHSHFTVSNPSVAEKSENKTDDKRRLAFIRAGTRLKLSKRAEMKFFPAHSLEL
jgi:hypothetical protein